IFKPGIIGNTLNACWWMTSAFVIYYSIWSLFATHLQKDLNFSPAQVATPIAVANFLAFLASGFWGWTADHIGRRWSMIIPGIIPVFVAPLYLLTANLPLIVVGFILQGLFGDALYGQNPSYLSERFPPRSGQRRAPSAIIRARTSAAWLPRCSRTSPSTTSWGSASPCWWAPWWAPSASSWRCCWVPRPRARNWYRT